MSEHMHLVLEPGVLRYVKGVNEDAFIEYDGVEWWTVKGSVQVYVELVLREMLVKVYKLQPEWSRSAFMFAYAAMVGVELKDALQVHHWMMRENARPSEVVGVMSRICSANGLFVYDHPLGEETAKLLWEEWRRE